MNKSKRHAFWALSFLGIMIIAGSPYVLSQSRGPSPCDSLRKAVLRSQALASEGAVSQNNVEDLQWLINAYSNTPNCQF